MTLSRSWVILVLDMVVWGADSMPMTPPLAPTAFSTSSLAIRLMSQTPLAPTWLMIMGLLECMTAS